MSKQSSEVVALWILGRKGFRFPFHRLKFNSAKAGRFLAFEVRHPNHLKAAIFGRWEAYFGWRWQQIADFDPDPEFGEYQWAFTIVPWSSLASKLDHFGCSPTIKQLKPSNQLISLINSNHSSHLNFGFHCFMTSNLRWNDGFSYWYFKFF